MADPLDKLMVTAGEVSRDMLADLLEKWIRLDPQSGAVIPLEAWHTLRPRQSILLFLLGRKAATLKNIIEGEGAAPKVIAEATGVPKGTVNPTLRDLVKERLLAQDTEGKYYVPPYAVGKVKDVITGGKNAG